MSEDVELEAMQKVLSALTPLDAEARNRVVTWIGNRMEIAIRRAPPPAVPGTMGVVDEQTGQSDGGGQDATLAEFFATASPKTNGEKALVVGYWKQEHEKQPSFDGQSINTELKHMGHQVSNITMAMNELQNQKPQLAVQLRKSGTTRQARKIYKVTTEGIKQVAKMLKKEETDKDE